jgi:hypothetical protein
VSEYAATNPLEDAVESFVHFVLDEPVYDTNRKTAKAQFFYQYAFFTQERERIRLIINN